VVWAIGTFIMAADIFLTSYFAASATSQAVNNAASSATMMRSAPDGTSATVRLSTILWIWCSDPTRQRQQRPMDKGDPHDSWHGSSIARTKQRCSRRGHADTRPRDRTG
jgi:hypothetical protein